MKTQIVKCSTSLKDPTKKMYKIQTKRGRFWNDYRVYGAVKLFTHKIIAQNYLPFIT